MGGKHNFDGTMILTSVTGSKKKIFANPSSELSLTINQPSTEPRHSSVRLNGDLLLRLHQPLTELTLFVLKLGSSGKWQQCLFSMAWETAFLKEQQTALNPTESLIIHNPFQHIDR